MKLLLIPVLALVIPSGNTAFYTLKADRVKGGTLYESGVAVRKGKIKAYKGNMVYTFGVKTIPRTRKGPSGTVRYMGNMFRHYNPKLTSYIEAHRNENLIDISSFKLKDIGPVCDAVQLTRMRHPETDISNAVDCLESDGILVNVKMTRNGTAASKTMKAADRIAAKARKKKGTAAKVQYVRNYLTGHVRYKKGKYSYCAYGALVDHKAVCQGYSEAFYLIMSKLKIPVRYDSEPRIDHIWNQVKIGKKWYAVDATWSTKNFVYDETLLLGKRKPQKK